jgi:hypothetical protein
MDDKVARHSHDDYVRFRISEEMMVSIRGRQVLVGREESSRGLAVSSGTSVAQLAAIPGSGERTVTAEVAS